MTETFVAPRLPSPLEELRDERLTERGVQLYLKRDDLIHPAIPGNKWRKLNYNISAAKDRGYSTLLTFGGAYSNHVRATAAVGRYFGFCTVGVIRGEEHMPLNWSLSSAVDYGMQLFYLDRTAYRDKYRPNIISQLREKYGEFYLLPEGGSNALAVRGCAEVLTEITLDFDVICCPVGTGGTLAGLTTGLSSGQRALGFAVLKGGQFLNREVAELQREAHQRVWTNWSIEQDFHFGGFAKSKLELNNFVSDFQCRHGLQLDSIYVAKMMYGIFALVESGKFSPGSVVVAVITGPGC